MQKVESCLGEKLFKILIKPNTDFLSPNNEIIVDEIIFEFEKSKLQILPIEDIDEIRVEILENDYTEKSGFTELKTFDKYLENLSMFWSCHNARDYFDIFIVRLLYFSLF